jgi:glycosyltransferase involved in cell wall biosynthesis
MKCSRVSAGDSNFRARKRRLVLILIFELNSVELSHEKTLGFAPCHKKTRPHPMIIFIDESIFEKQKFGGISRYFCELSHAIVTHTDHTVVIYGGWSQSAYLDTCKTSDQLKVIQAGPVLRKLEFARKWLNPVLRKLHFLKLKCTHKNQALIYHPSYFRLDSFVAALSQVSVLSVYDLIYENRAGKKRLKKMAKRKSLQNRVDQIIAISMSTAHDLAEFNPAVKDKISVIHLATNPPANLIQRVGQKSKDTFLFVGSRGAYKNGKLAIEAFAHLQKQADRPLKMVFAGGGSFEDDELELIQGFDLKEQIEQRDMSDLELAEAYHHAIALVYPSSYEGFGLPLLEAMQVDCPVIAQNISSMPEVLGDWGHYMKEDRYEALLAEMRTVLRPLNEKNGQARESLRQQQLANFSWRKTAEETVQVYQQGLAAKS